MSCEDCRSRFLFFFQAEDGIRYLTVTGVQTCALPILPSFPAVSLAKSLCPSSVKTTWRGLPALLSRTIRTPASALKSAAHNEANSEYRQPVSIAPRTRLRNAGSQALTSPTHWASER